MKLGSYRDVGKITDLQTFMRFASQIIYDMASTIDGGIAFDSNITTETKPIYFPAANVDVQINHNLKKTNLNYLVVQKPVTCDVYHGVGTDTAQSVFLRSTVGGVTLTVRLD